MINIKEQKLPNGEGYLYSVEITTPDKLEFDTVKYFIQLLKQELERRQLSWL